VRKLFEDMRFRLESFLAQRRSLLMVVRAGPAEYLPLVSCLDGIEQDSSDEFWLFQEPFESPSRYAQAVVESFRARYTVLAPELRKAGFEVPLDLPPEVSAQSYRPVDRLRSLLLFARSLIDDLEGTRLVAAFLPTKISNPTEFAQLILAVAAHEMPQPWCHHMRILVREDAQLAPLSDNARTMTAAEFYAPDMGQASVQASLEQEAFNAGLPLPQRMQSLLLLAGMDLAYRRFPEASKKYALLAKYHGALGPKPLHALSLNGIGEVFDRSGNKKEAKHYYELALVPAVQAQDPASLINITGNLANLNRLAGNWRDALGYYEGLSMLAKAVGNDELQLRSLEQMGFCKHKLGDVKGAWEHWNAGVTLAREAASKEHLLDCLERIHGLYKEANLAVRGREIEPEIAELRRQGVRPYPA
jgi:tetratricopeptide (TPR) repeat protein